ncbi:hypothetical protein FHX41_4508 [Actinomadura hallensis]|uniref:Uncharacterized protein n=1 Tax=Actinomadura hallensis TaxID=337895 RepID=A0A543IJM7_9ACTN|nr:hypothetical protein [Actinomadura hallensis]TQM70772.1 hypothetical protein FHX41_4508 [Actinomadura hallensis]HLV74234.1 hypothetical protein [Vulgatibacteraceae bacterium]
MNAADNGAWCVDPSAYLAELRREFPAFGIIADPARPIWMAVRGNDVFIRATDGHVLRQRLRELSDR